jgi:acyl-CoA synthetase (AMP-forming)/AMP-acid ligase II
MVAHVHPDALFSSNFSHLLRRAGLAFGMRTAIAHRDNMATFEQLSARAGAIGIALRKAHFGAGQRCAILCENPIDAAAAFFAVLAVGGVAININELYRARQIEYVLRHSESSVLLTRRDAVAAKDRALETAAAMVFLEEVTSTGDSLDVAEAAADDPAQIVYTSGSSGQPKGVLTSHGALWAGVRIVADYLGLEPGDRIASILPFSFVYGFNQLTTALWVGATLVVERSTLAAEIVEMLRRERVTVLAAVPPLWQLLLGVPTFREPLPHLRIMTCAGGRLAPNTVRDLRHAQPQARLYLMYGLTEVFRSTYLPPELVDAYPDSMGRAIPKSVVYVVRDDGTLADPGEVGELVHGGPTVALGYVGDAEATALVYRANPFLVPGETEPARVVFSGDLVKRDSDGLLYYVGRRDRVIKTLGFRVGPDEILDVIQESQLVKDAELLTEPDATRGERILACVVLREDAQVEHLKRFCRIELPRHMQPSAFVTVAAIPRNANGKHDLSLLREQVLEQKRA